MRYLFALLVLAATPAAAQDITKADVVRPAGAPAAAKAPDLVARGAAYFKDPKLSTNEMSCNSCHADLQSFNDGFKAPYPHFVQMAKDVAGLEAVTAETMVQLCMMAPMASKPLAWDSLPLAALTAYVGKLQDDFRKK
jgi:cytochrome c